MLGSYKNVPSGVGRGGWASLGGFGAWGHDPECTVSSGLAFDGTNGGAGGAGEWGSDGGHE